MGLPGVRTRRPAADTRAAEKDFKELLPGNRSECRAQDMAASNQRILSVKAPFPPSPAACRECSVGHPNNGLPGK